MTLVDQYETGQVARMADDYDDLEAEADAFLGENPDHSAAALIKNLRKWGKKAEQRGREQATAEFAQRQARDAAFARIPEAVRPLFEGIDPTDEKAITAKLDALKALGLKVDADSPEAAPATTQPQQTPSTSTTPVIDPATVQAMQQAAAGGSASGSGGDLATRMRAMEANPGAYTDEQVEAAVREYNAAVTAAGMQRTSGALG